jgi:hypothetical protein
MRKEILIICFLLGLFPAGTAFANILQKNIHFSEICGLDFTVDTQKGKIEARFSVCHLQSEFGSDNGLYVVISYAQHWPAHVDKIIKEAHSPVIRKKNNRIDILYTSGVNTTCVTTYTLKSGIPEFVSTKTIAWNDGGHFRRSADFEKYSDLWNSRF